MYLEARCGSTDKLRNQNTGNVKSLGSCPPTYTEPDELDDFCEFVMSLDDESSAESVKFPGQTNVNVEEISKQIAKERSQGVGWPHLSPVSQNEPKLQVYNLCWQAATHNVLGPRCQIASCNNIDVWRKLSTGHSEDEWLIDCIQFGFPLQFRGPPINNHFNGNHPSAVNFPSHINKYIEKELRLGALAGPFEHKPFDPWCNIGPLMTREKATSADRRVIVDLSFPPGTGPNSYIAKNAIFGQIHQHTLPSVQDAVNIIVAHEFNVLLASIDISRAYRNFPVCPYDWPLNCIFHGGSYYIDLCMPFGSRISSCYMQKMANFIARALLSKGVMTIIYLDDLLLICPRDQNPDEGFNIALQTVRALGLPVAWEKVITPATSIKFLGIIIDITKRETRIPKNKIEQFLQLIRDLLQKKYTSVKVIQRVVGHINYIGNAVPSARLFMNRILCSLREASGNSVRIDWLLRRDLNWFDKFLTQFNGKSIIVSNEYSIVIEADSCLTGGGGWTGNVCYSCVYPTEVSNGMHISQLECLNCLIAVRTLLTGMRDVCVKIICDNSAAISCLATGRGRDNTIMSICRAFWYLSSANNIRFVFQHAPGSTMILADALSRAHLSEGDFKHAAKLVEDKGMRYVPVSPESFKYNEYF